jgi:pyridoxamine 5'-phosphate oxidase
VTTELPTGDRVTDPIALFLSLRERARSIEPWEATACVLATADARGRPSARFVLVKEADAEGFFFYTNHGSRKARELADNPFAALCFHWDTLGVQFRVEGSVERATAGRSDAYFAARPRISQLGAWASEQGRPLASRDELLARLSVFEGRFAGGDVPRPEHWGGYRIRPERIEYWINGEFRLHDRFEYQREGDAWRVTRLAP